MEFARAVSEQLGLDTALLQPVPTSQLGQRAPRPLSAGLRTEKLARLHPTIHMRTLEESLRDCADQLRVFTEN